MLRNSTKRIDARIELKPRVLCAALHQVELCAHLVQQVGGRLAWETLKGHPIQTAPVIGYARAQAPDFSIDRALARTMT
jgi:hypothetical protein